MNTVDIKITLTKVGDHWFAEWDSFSIGSSTVGAGKGDYRATEYEAVADALRSMDMEDAHGRCPRCEDEG